HTEKRGLLKLHGQSKAQRVVKHSVTRLIVEIREDNSVLVRESWRAVKIKVPGDRERQHSCRSSWKNNLPAFRAVGRSGGRLRRSRVSFQPLEVGAKVRRVLIAQIPIFFETL